MNSLNLRQVCGGDTIKQADFGSELAFELLDEQYVKFRETLGASAKVILKKDNIAIYQKSVPITQNTVSFKFDKILPVGSYVLEIIVGDYVFPSNNRVVITIEQTYGQFEPEYLVSVSYEELKADIDDLKSKVQSLESGEKDVIAYDDSSIIKRIETLEAKPDNDTIYDDTDIQSKLSGLEQKTNEQAINLANMALKISVMNPEEKAFKTYYKYDENSPNLGVNVFDEKLPKNIFVEKGVKKELDKSDTYTIDGYLTGKHINIYTYDDTELLSIKWYRRAYYRNSDGTAVGFEVIKEREDTITNNEYHFVNTEDWVFCVTFRSNKESSWKIYITDVVGEIKRPPFWLPSPYDSKLIGSEPKYVCCLPAHIVKPTDDMFQWIVNPVLDVLSVQYEQEKIIGRTLETQEQVNPNLVTPYKWGVGFSFSSKSIVAGKVYRKSWYLEG